MNDRLHSSSPASMEIPPPPPSSSPVSSFAPQRSLTDDEIRSIFEVLYQNDETTTAAVGDQVQNEPPLPRFPNGISFSIVPCGSHCEKLSPPPYTFPNGLYVLLRPTKKVTTATTKTVTPMMTECGSSDRFPHSVLDTHESIPVVPPHLQRYPIWTTNVTAATTGMIDCQWRLSGPQFPPPTATMIVPVEPCYIKPYEQCHHCAGIIRLSTCFTCLYYRILFIEACGK